MHQQNHTFYDLDPGSPEFAKILTYPRHDDGEHAARLSELYDLGISSIILGGSTIISGVNVAGKGCVGLVVRARVGKKTLALKIRRTDANRKSMEGEVRLHKIANDAGVGPRLYDHSANFILMEFVEGPSISEWVPDAKKRQTQAVARSVLEQCYLLDRSGLDHGQLSRLDRHVIISDKYPTIIDFETASTERRTSNVSSAAQSLFVASAIASMVQRIIGKTDRESAISALKRYKQDQTRSGLAQLFDAMGI